MIFSPLRLFAIATLLAVSYVVLEKRFRCRTCDEPSTPVDVEYSRTNLKTSPRPPIKYHPLGLESPSITPRAPYVAISPHPVMRKSLKDLPIESSQTNRTLSGIVVFPNGSAVANQAVPAELILYRPKPDVIFSGTIYTDGAGKFELFLGTEFLSTTSLSMHVGIGAEQEAFERYASAHVAQVSFDEEIELGYFVLTSSED